MVTAAEREVADLLAIEVDPVVARAIVETVPFWFHTFALNRAEGIYTSETVTPSDDHGAVFASAQAVRLRRRGRLAGEP